MYKIYYNETAISLMHTAIYQQIDQINDGGLMVHYTGKTKLILSIIDKIEKNQELKQVYIFANDLKRLKNDFFSLFKIVPAAGGLVLNAQSDMLLIYRRGSWDLPKGKMEIGETKKESAVREVVEETGLINVQLIKKLTTTYHIYPNRSNKRVLKPSYWYLMWSTDTLLKPQIEEDIEKAEWVSLSDFRAAQYEPMYSNIREVIKSYMFDVLDVY